MFSTASAIPLRTSVGVILSRAGHSVVSGHYQPYFPNFYLNTKKRHDQSVTLDKLEID